MMNKNFIFKIIVSIILISIILPTSFSRLKTSWDFPSDYTYSIKYLEENRPDSKIIYEVKGGVSVAYEHYLFGKDKFKGYLGAEIMFGKASNMTMAFHSLYFMPTYPIDNDTQITFKIGYTNLNSSVDLPQTHGFMLAIGPEIKISENWAIHFSSTWYEMFDKVLSPGEINSLFINPEGEVSEADIGIIYDKLAISLIYGFDREKKE